MSMQLENGDLLLTHGWINGAEVAADSSFAVFDPATLAVVAEVSDLRATHAHDAITAATAAFQQWRAKPLQERVSIVLAWANLIEANADDLGRIICRENGKPLREAQGEARQCAALMRWFADAIPEACGVSVPRGSGEQRNYTIKQPVGVVACITPWNFPAAAVAVKTGAAILSGCTTIVKPSEETPLIALALAKLSHDAGLPAGVLNVIPCKNPAEVGAELCQSSDVRMLSFTGSTRVGKQLYSACGDTVKRLALELGGNAPFVVFDDADMDKAIAAATGARFYNSGQICVGANRFLVHKKIYADFATQFAQRVSAMSAGNGLDEASDIGPMINRAAVNRLNHLIDNATKLGAEVLTGGRQDDNETLFFEPTVLSKMTPDMAAYQTEVFGPVACLYEFDSEEQALEMANDTDAGLSAYIFGADQERLLRCSEALEAGVIGANSSNIFANDLPFGGIKQSGLGREHGLESLDEFVESKSICLGSQ
ncbi:MAG: NAD-dependent succinate-semialdehyde dehydrogenase [Woeseiaceae bacterium]